MAYKVSEIAKILGAEYAGDGDLIVNRTAEPSNAKANDLVLAMASSYAEALQQGAAQTAVLWEGADWQSLNLKAAIFVARPRYAMAQITKAFDIPPAKSSGIHPTAVIDPSTTIGKNASIGALVVIGANTSIGENAQIQPHVTIAEDVQIGANALLHSGTRISARVQIGDNFITQPNAVIGGDGFSFVTPEAGAIEAVRSTLDDSNTIQNQAFQRIYSNATVVIGNDVEVGSNSAIDKGTVANTCIGNGTKLDNHVQVGHNVIIGENCLLCGHAAVAGSAILGNNVILGGKVGVKDHVNIGDGVIVGASSTILSNVPAGRAMLGTPATPMKIQMEMYKALRRLPRLMKRLTK